MKNVLINGFVILFLASGFAAFGQENVYVSKSVLKTADWAGFKYNEVLKKSMTGDQNALNQFFKFSSVVDGVEGIDHAVTCLELIPLASDQNVSSSLLLANDKLKKLILDRLVLAQSKTKKAELRQAIQSWAPFTWAALNHLPAPVNKLDDAKVLEKAKRVDDSNRASDLSPVKPTVRQ